MKALQGKTKLIVSLFIIVFFSFTQIPVERFQLTFLHNLEQQLHDVRTRLTLTNEVDDRIVIIDIDENSLQEVGQWPWSRKVLAKLVDQLFDNYQVDTLGFDVVFAEKEVDHTKQILESLSNGALAQNQQFKQAIKDIVGEESADQQFAKALMGRKTVAGFIFHEEAKTINQLDAALTSIYTKRHQSLPIISAKGYTGNLQAITEATQTSGFFDNPALDSDGVYRRVPLLQEYQNNIYPSLALATARTALNDLPFDIGWVETGNQIQIEYFQLGSTIIPVDHQGAVIIPYKGPAFSFDYVPAADVLDGRADKNRLYDKIVLLGTSATGLEDLRSTPVLGEQYPGVEIHANIISGILNQIIPSEPAWAFVVNIFIVLVTGLLMILLVARLAPIKAIISTLGIACIIIICNFLAWKQGMILNLIAPLLTLSLLYIWQATYGYLTETRNKNKIARQFGQYIPPQIVDEMLNRPDELSLKGENRNMTVLFSDIRDFTELSEGLDPELLTQLMNELLTPLTQIIHNNRGTIDKYIGDAIMAFWGAPLKEPQHAKLAVKTALEFQQKLEELQPSLRKYGLSKLEIGIGINTGEMSVGNMGSEFRMAYTVMGDAVNLASRIEDLTKEYKVNTLISKNTLNEIPELHCRPIDRIKVKGKSKFVEVFEPLKID